MRHALFLTALALCAVAHARCEEWPDGTRQCIIDKCRSVEDQNSMAQSYLKCAQNGCAPRATSIFDCAKADACASVKNCYDSYSQSQLVQCIQSCLKCGLQWYIILVVVILSLLVAGIVIYLWLRWQRKQRRSEEAETALHSVQMSMASISSEQRVGADVVPPAPQPVAQ